jgi:hypothetical protein
MAPAEKFKAKQIVRAPATKLSGQDLAEWKNQNPGVNVKYGTVICVVVRHGPGARSYTVRLRDLSSKRELAVATSQLRLVSANLQLSDSEDGEDDVSDEEVAADEGAESDDSRDSAEEDGEPARDDSCEHFGLKDMSVDKWQPVDSVPTDPLHEQYPNFDASFNARIRLADGDDDEKCLPFYLAFLPLRELRQQFPAWNAALKGCGAPCVTDGLLHGFVALLIYMSLIQLSSRSQYWDAECKISCHTIFHEVMSHYAFEKMLAVLRDHLPQYAPGDIMPDGRTVTDKDRLQPVRRFYDIVFARARSKFTAGPDLVPDETMVKWTADSGPHLTNMPRKPCPLGVGAKTVACGSSRVLLYWEFMEAAEEQGKKKWNEGGRIVGCTLRMLEHWMGDIPRRVYGDSWFGSLATVHALRCHNLFAVMVIKGGSKHIPAKEMIANVMTERNKREWRVAKLLVRFVSTCACSVCSANCHISSHVFATSGIMPWRNASNAQNNMQVNGVPRTFVCGAHMDKQPMLVLATCGTSLEAGELHRQRTIYDQELCQTVIWRATAEQPMMHGDYRGKFNGVDINNRHCHGPGSIAAISTKSPYLKLAVAAIATIVTNAFLAYMHRHKLTSRDMSFRRFKELLADELMEAMRLERGGEARPGRGSGTASSRGSRAAGSGASAAARTPEATVQQGHEGLKRGKWDRTAVPPSLAGHTLTNSGKNSRPSCEMCGQRTSTLCSCGRAICNPVGLKGACGPTCMLGHMMQVLSNTCPAVSSKKPRGVAAHESEAE